MSSKPSQKWTLAGDLTKVGRATELSTALQSLGLIDEPTRDFRLTEISTEWTRGGAETYIYRFKVTAPDGVDKYCILKACVAYAIGRNLEGILNSWIERRAILSNAGVGTPRLYGWGEGIIVEEYIPYELRDVLASNESKKNPIFEQLVIYAATLSKCGFRAVGPFSDLRSRGQDIVVVDFGEDLGAQDVRRDPYPEIFNELVCYIESFGVILGSGERDAMRAAFARHGGEMLH